MYYSFLVFFLLEFWYVIESLEFYKLFLSLYFELLVYYLCCILVTCFIFSGLILIFYYTYNWDYLAEDLDNLLDFYKLFIFFDYDFLSRLVHNNFLKELIISKDYSVYNDYYKGSNELSNKLIFLLILWVLRILVFNFIVLIYNFLFFICSFFLNFFFKYAWFKKGINYFEFGSIFFKYEPSFKSLWSRNFEISIGIFFIIIFFFKISILPILFLPNCKDFFLHYNVFKCIYIFLLFIFNFFLVLSFFFIIFIFNKVYKFFKYLLKLSFIFYFLWIISFVFTGLILIFYLFGLNTVFSGFHIFLYIHKVFAFFLVIFNFLIILIMSWPDRGICQLAVFSYCIKIFEISCLLAVIFSFKISIFLEFFEALKGFLNYCSFHKILFLNPLGVSEYSYTTKLCNHIFFFKLYFFSNVFNFLIISFSVPQYCDFFGKFPFFISLFLIFLFGIFLLATYSFLVKVFGAFLVLLALFFYFFV